MRCTKIRIKLRGSGNVDERGKNLELSRWFEDTSRCALIVVSDFYGFAAEACALIRRDSREAEFTIFEVSSRTVVH